MNVVRSRWRKAGIERESWRFEVYNSAIASCGSAQWQVALALMEDCLFVSNMKCIGCVFVHITKMDQVGWSVDRSLQNAVACFWRIWFTVDWSYLLVSTADAPLSMAPTGPWAPWLTSRRHHLWPGASGSWLSLKFPGFQWLEMSIWSRQLGGSVWGWKTLDLNHVKCQHVNMST